MLGLTLLFLWFQTGNNGPFMVLWIAHFLLYAVCHAIGFHLWLARLLFGHRMDIVMSPDFIKVGGWLRYKTAPNMLLNFTNVPHQRAKHEAAEEQRKGKIMTPYYREASQIIMYNGEIPTVLASVYNSEKIVTAILIRLQNMQQLIQQQQMQ